MIIPAPYWVSYPDIALIAEGKPVIVECGIEQGFKMTAGAIESRDHAENQNGRHQQPEQPVRRDVFRRRIEGAGRSAAQAPHVLIATDDMYEHMRLTDEKFCNILNVCPDLYPRTMTLNGVSKAYSMTGWRIGYAAARKTSSRRWKTCSRKALPTRLRFRKWPRKPR